MKYLPILLLILLFSCSQDKEEVLPLLQQVENPSKEGGEPNLFVSASGQIYLSWVEYLNDTTDALQYAILKDRTWTSPKRIAQGSNWFVNWADFPSLVVYGENDQYLAAHWLQMRGKGTYDYDVRISQSADGGQQWLPSFIPHRDSIAAEHGFVTLLPISDQKVFATWLDGRNTKNEGGHSHHGHGGGAMTLRTATFDSKGQLSEEYELDNRICDCCQTAAALTSNGPIVAYRDRSEEEIRDIYIVRKTVEGWSKPKPVYTDNWKIAGCPVNGPAITASANQVAVAWYTAANEKPAVKIAFSSDAGATFGKPIQIDGGQALGRVDVLFLNKKEVLVSWLEDRKDGAEIRASRVGVDGEILESYILTKSDAGRKSGFPILAKANERLFVAWTQVDSVSTSVQTAQINL